MAEEVYIVDPDVWKSSKDNPHCHVSILDICDDVGRKIALDEGEIEREYLDVLESPSVPDELRKRLQIIFNERERSDKITTLKPQYPADLNVRIQKWGCSTPVEPVLIGMAAANTSFAVRLLLVGNDGLRRRGLHIQDNAQRLRSYFRSQLHKGVEVVLASDIGLPKQDQRVRGYEGRTFEDQIRMIFDQRIRTQTGQIPSSRKPTPGQVARYKDSTGHEAGEIDVYLCVDTSEERLIWVCECELREAGNEGQPTTRDKVLKLRRKVEAVKDFERTQKSEVVVRGFIVTNAETLSPDAKEVMTGCDFQYCRVTMPKKWQTNYRWELTGNDISPFDL